MDLRIYITYVMVLKRHKVPAKICQEWYMPEESRTTHIGAWNFRTYNQKGELMRDMSKILGLHPVAITVPFYATPAFLMRYLNPIIKFPPMIKLKAIISHWWIDKRLKK